jgi:GNAT superfamily N-acetyltransferase
MRRLRDTLFGAKPTAEAVVARVGSDAVGFALWFHNYSTFLAQPGLYLEDLFVLPAWRGRGVGAALLRHLARVASEQGCGRMEWSVLNWNESAIGFYRKMGARPMDGWTVYRLTGDDLRRAAE